MNIKRIDKITQGKGGAKIITLRHILREKIGFGGLEPLLLERAEEYLKNNEIDFHPYATDFMHQLAMAIESAQAAKIRDRKAIDSITAPLMHLKAGGGMFRYPLISQLADIVLAFLEGLDTLNDDAFEILAVHQRVLGVILTGKLTGNGGKPGKTLVNELLAACARYRKKHDTKNV